MARKNHTILDGLVCLFATLLFFACSDKKNSTDQLKVYVSSQRQYDVKRIDTLGLVVLYPHFNSIDLVCGLEPSKSDTSVILFAEAAYTGQCMQEFDHFNIAGDHVSSGIRYKGYPCQRNTGAFVYYNGNWQFLFKNYSRFLDEAATHGGAAFAQELIIHDSKLMPTIRKDSNRNQFRALCEHNATLCVVESANVLSFKDFCNRLLRYGISNAIYLDMGSGWNYAWYREGNSIKELHPKTHEFCTNWITFYK